MTSTLRNQRFNKSARHLLCLAGILVFASGCTPDTKIVETDRGYYLASKLFSLKENKKNDYSYLHENKKISFIYAGKQVDNIADYGITQYIE